MNRENEIRLNWRESLENVKKGWELSGGIGYAFCQQDLLILLGFHKAGLFREKIEELLTDCNFHTESGLLNNEDYEACFDIIINEY